MSDNRYDDAEEPRETEPDKSKFEGFHFTRLSAVVILTFIILVAALAIDSLSTYHKVAYTGSNSDETDSCRADGDCGWRSGSTNWVDGGMSKCDGPTGTADSKTISYNYETLCENGSDDACLALDAGNVYLIFTIFAIIFNSFTICIIVPRVFICVFNPCTHNHRNTLYEYQSTVGNTAYSRAKCAILRLVGFSLVYLHVALFAI